MRAPILALGLLSVSLAAQRPGASDFCDRVNPRSGALDGSSSKTHVVINRTNDDHGAITYQMSVPGRCVEARIIGDVVFSSDDRTIVRMDPDAIASFRERVPSSDRSARILSVHGRIETHAAFNGASVGNTDDVRAWLAEFLPEVLRELGINAVERVARVHQSDGVPGVLELIARIQSGGGRRAHYSALLDRSLSPAEYESVVRHASRRISSSGDLSRLLRRVPVERLRSESAREAINDAVTRVASSGDRTETLIGFARAADRDMLLALARAARTIPSSGDKTRFLRSSAARYLGGQDAALHDGFFDVAATVPSSGDLRSVLDTAIAFGRNDVGIVRAIMSHAARHIASSGDRAHVLVGLVTAGLVNTTALRQGMRDAARTLPSNGDYRRVMDALFAAER